MSIEIITTEDGSHSLFNSVLNETYHSVHGAIQESKHVFIKAGLEHRLRQSNPAQIHILEVGFGTGLNALLTLQHAIGLKNKFYYTTLETFPLPETIWSKLNYSDSITNNYFEKLHASPWEKWQLIAENVELLKMNSSLEIAQLVPNHYDLIFFDAFAPSKQPEMWQLSQLEKIVKSMKAGAIYVTYCAKGQLKRDLKSLGLHVESLPGPPGKMEMVRGSK